MKGGEQMPGFSKLAVGQVVGIAISAMCMRHLPTITMVVRDLLKKGEGCPNDFPGDF